MMTIFIHQGNKQVTHVQHQSGMVLLPLFIHNSSVNSRNSFTLLLFTGKRHTAVKIYVEQDLTSNYTQLNHHKVHMKVLDKFGLYVEVLLDFITTKRVAMSLYESLL